MAAPTHMRRATDMPDCTLAAAAARLALTELQGDIALLKVQATTNMDAAPAELLLRIRSLEIDVRLALLTLGSMETIKFEIQQRQARCLQVLHVFAWSTSAAIASTLCTIIILLR